MSESDVRRGPGWWMDPDGRWNPPETWPEAEPPLPGWRLGEDGRWQPPVAVSDELAEDEDGDDSPRVRSKPRITVASGNSVRADLPRPPIEPSIRVAAVSAIVAGLAALLVAVTAIVVVTFL